MNACSVDECEKPAKTRGWCGMHYVRWQRHGSVDVTSHIRTTDGICLVTRCEQPSRKRGWCTMHYARWDRLGSADAAVGEYKRSYSGQCEIAECTEKNYAHGLCKPHYGAKYRTEHRDYFRAKAAERKALEMALTIGSMTDEQLSERIAYYGGKCWICREAPYEHLDHVKPLGRGGPHVLSNLRPACAPCNLAKKDKWLSPRETQMALFGDTPSRESTPLP